MAISRGGAGCAPLIVLVVLAVILLPLIRSSDDRSVISEKKSPEIDDGTRKVLSQQKQTIPNLVNTCRSLFLNIKNWTDEENRLYSRQGCWHKVEADNGAVYLINMGLVQDFGSGATAPVYNEEGGQFNPMNMKRWYFSCAGHYCIMQDRGGTGPMIYAPPRSVAAQIGAIVCLGAGLQNARQN